MIIKVETNFEQTMSRNDGKEEEMFVPYLPGIYGFKEKSGRCGNLLDET